MLKRIKGKLQRRDDSNNKSGSHPLTSSQPKSGSDAERQGLFLIADKQDLLSGSDTFSVDIIVIHGVEGDPTGTWRSPTDVRSLKRFLPEYIPGCRVYAYRYPPKAFLESSLSRVITYSKRLLNSIKNLQDENNGEPRSILFLCHSIGGILCKQALVDAQNEDKVYGALLRSVIGIVFLGTPHRGSGVDCLASIFAKVLNVSWTDSSVELQPEAAVRTEVLDGLARDSTALHESFVSSRELLDRIAVVSFYETEPTPPFPTLIVDRTSSMLGIASEDVIPSIFHNHKTISRGDDMMLVKCLWRVANDSVRSSETLKRTGTSSSEKSLDDLDESCMALFNSFDVASYKRLLPQPMAGTCHWLSEDPAFTMWLAGEGNEFLWLTGHSGCGKTMLCLYLSHYLEEKHQSENQNTLVFFFDDNHNTQNDAKTILRALIYQMINRQPSLIRHVRHASTLQGASLTQSFSSLWNIFMRIAKNLKAGSIYVILDSLDACEASSRQQLLTAISELVASHDELVHDNHSVKFLVTSRPLPQESIVDFPRLSARISIDESQGYAQDLRAFIRHRVTERSTKHNYESKVEKRMLQSMYSKANPTFIWVHMTLELVESGLGASMRTSMENFETILANILPDVQTLYRQYLSTIPETHRHDAEHLLQLFLASSWALHIDEINTALGIKPTHIAVDEVAQDSRATIVHTIQDILGPLIRVSDSRVTLVHVSLKNYLLSGVDSSLHLLSEFSTEQSALRMASACIWYLSLQDFRQDIFIGEPLTTQSNSTIEDLDDDSLGKLRGDSNSLRADLLFREHGGLRSDISHRITSQYPFYRYASMNWAEHLSHCEDMASDALRKAAMSLLDMKSRASRNWIQVYLAASGEPIDESLMKAEELVLAARFNLHRGIKGLLQGQEFPQDVKDQSLFYASQARHDRIVTEMLLAGANPNQQHLPSGQSALTVAAEHGHLKCITALLASKTTNVNSRGRDGRSALSFACGNGHYDIVKALLKNNDCDHSLVDDSGVMPLLRAVWGGDMQIISLVARYAHSTVNHQDQAGRTALSWAAESDMHEAILKLLDVPGVDANKKDNNGRSPLSWAAGSGSDKPVQILLQNKRVDRQSVDNTKRNELSWACEGGHLITVRILMHEGYLGIRGEDMHGWQPLDWAVKTNQVKVAQTLLTTGLVDLEHKDRSGKTALAWAVQYGHVAMVRMLMEEGASPAQMCFQGRTPKSIAAGMERADLLEELGRRQIGWW